MNIKPIRLLKGSHDDTASTGQGCFMNVIAYLNGEPQITDESPCVCVTVRPLAIKLNDLGTEEQRSRLLPFVLRAMGSATEDMNVLSTRVTRLREYGEECHELMRDVTYPNTYAVVNSGIVVFAFDVPVVASAYANAYSNAYFNAYGDTAYVRNSIVTESLRSALFDAGLRFLDDVLPAAEPASLVVSERCETLVKLQAVAA